MRGSPRTWGASNIDRLLGPRSRIERDLYPVVAVLLSQPWGVLLPQPGSMGREVACEGMTSPRHHSLTAVLYLLQQRAVRRLGSGRERLGGGFEEEPR